MGAGASSPLRYACSTQVELRCEASYSQPLRAELELPNVLHALSDPLRLEIVRQLDERSKEVACGRLQARVSKSTLSHHLKVLRDAGLTETRVDGTQRLVSLRRAD